MVQEIEFNNNFAQAQDLGSFSSSSNSRTVNGSVNMSDVNDVFKFRLNAGSSSNFASNLQINLTQISNGNNDVDLELFNDANNNGFMDAGDKIIDSFNQAQKGNKSLEVRGMFDETYFVRVRKDRGSDVGTGHSTYRLDITSQATQGQEQEPNNSLAQADVIEGNLNNNRRFQGSVRTSFDTFDFYKFKVDTPSQFFANITPQGGSNKVNFFLAKDFNNNGRLDGSEYSLGQTFEDNGSKKSIGHNNLQPGTYFLQVGSSSASAGATVNYDLAVGAFPL